MKPEIHPKYHPTARIACACGNVIVVGATVAEMTTEVCASCHPFFTGEQRIVDTAGQVERFMRRLEQGETQRVAERTRAQQLQEQRLAERRKRRGLTPLGATKRSTRGASRKAAPSAETREAGEGESGPPGEAAATGSSEA